MTFKVQIKECKGVLGNDLDKDRYEEIVGELSFADKHEFAEKVRTDSLGVKLGNIERFGFYRIIDATNKDFSGVDLSGTVIHWHIDFDGSDFSGANLSRTDFFSGKLKHCNLTGADLKGADFFYANLNHARLIDVKISDTSFNNACLGGADCRGVDFRGARLIATEFNNFFYGEKSADLRGANLSNVDATHAKFREANCEGTDFRGAILRGANFRNTKLDKANLSDADIKGALFWAAEMNGTNFSRSRGTLSADFRFANINSTVWQNRIGLERYVHKYVTIPIQNIMTPG